MAVDMFLKLDQLEGEAQDAVHRGSIDVLAWSWGLSNSGTFHFGGGAGAGKVSVQDLSITKYVDRSSPILMGRCSDGNHFAEGRLIVRKTGATPVEYIVLGLTNVLVTSVSTGGSGGEDRLTENVSLNFEKYRYTYTPQLADGSAGGPVEWAWDIAANTAL